MFDSLYPSLRRFAAVLADPDVNPDDLVQEALAATLSRHRLSELQHPRAYLKQAMVRTASNRRRRAARFRALTPKVAGPEHTEDHYPSDLAILDQLGPVDRVIVFLADVEGQPIHQIANDLGMNAAAVRKRVSRARKSLRALIAPDLKAVDGETP